VLCNDLSPHIEREDALILVSLFCPLISFSASFSIFSRKQASQYATLLPAFQPDFSSSSSKTEHLMQKALAQLKQIYFVGAKQEPHILVSSTAAIISLEIYRQKFPSACCAHVMQQKTVELWVKYNLT